YRSYRQARKYWLHLSQEVLSLEAIFGVRFTIQHQGRRLKQEPFVLSGNSLHLTAKPLYQVSQVLPVVTAVSPDLADGRINFEQLLNHPTTTLIYRAHQRNAPPEPATVGEYKTREELLLILKYPWLPLHNSWSERQIREYVKRRKISGGARSALGQRCRDTFASLKKTCKLHGVSFSRYLKDQISGAGIIPQL
ncbi:MAG: hypothetical protein OXC41_07965, partial [Gammaproteobacteria bacterium]|nr:hypothetical protein [Gammaproteobacteria bacterium]